MRKERNEAVIEFNRRFHSFYFSIPRDIQPSETIARLYYIVAHHHPELVLFMRERRSISLQHMFIDPKEIEGKI